MIRVTQERKVMAESIYLAVMVIDCFKSIGRKSIWVTKKRGEQRI